MSDVPSSDWGNDLSLMSANVPELSDELYGTFFFLCAHHLRVIRPPSARHATLLLHAICPPSAHHPPTIRPPSAHHLRVICPHWYTPSARHLRDICAHIYHLFITPL